MRQPRDIIFDLDGTLVDSAPGILAAFQAVLSAYGISPRCSLDSRLIGPPLAETLAWLSGIADPVKLTPLITDFKRRYDAEGVAATPAYAGIDSLLDKLVRNQICLHIATNKRIAPTRAVVGHLGWMTHFASLHALDLYVPSLPNKTELLARVLAEHGLSPETCLYVGDKHEDGEAADRNGIPFVAAAWGYGNFTQDEVPRHWTVLARPSTLEEFFFD